MRFHAFVIALTVLAAFASDSWGQSQRPSPSGAKASQQEQGKPAETNKPASTEQKSAPQPPIIVHVEPAKKTEAEAEEDRHERKEKADLDRRLVDLTAELSTYTGGLYSATVILAIATIALVLATVGLVVMAILQSRDMKASVAVAQRAAEVAERALVGVERPILFITMPESQVSFPDGVLTSGKPTYGILAQNVGKQIATIQAGEANFIVQADSVPPVPTMLDGPDGSFCHIRILGEVSILPGKSEVFVCQRSDSLTETELAGLKDGSLYGFFRVGLVYSDPVGTLRQSVFVFAQMLADSQHERGFIQVLSSDTVASNPQTTPKQKKEAQRIFVGGQLKFYREFDAGKNDPSKPNAK